MGKNQRIYVLMGTYNGARFVRDQLRSIQEQTLSGWTLLVRDDGSQDGTLKILLDCAKTDKRIRCIHDSYGRLGAVGNFGELMRIACLEAADYVFFSDQDDIWMSNKIADQVVYLKDMEIRYGEDTPILVYSDLEVVDETLQRVHPSFMNYQGLVHEAQDPLRVLLTQNFVTGCATVVNRPLLDLAVPMPDEVVMHDWWLALCAAACGQIGYSPIPTLQYRQHTTNLIGAQRFWAMMNPLSLRTRRRWRESKHQLFKSIRMAALLSERIKLRGIPCSAETTLLLDRFVGCAMKSPLDRVWTASRVGLRRQGLTRYLLLYWRLLVLRN